MRYFDTDIMVALHEWRNDFYRETEFSVGIIEKDIVIDDNIKSVLCLYYYDKNGENSDVQLRTLRSVMRNKFDLKYVSAQSFAENDRIRREIYFSV